jgi:hypothetical protein
VILVSTVQIKGRRQPNPKIGNASLAVSMQVIEADQVHAVILLAMGRSRGGTRQTRRSGGAACGVEADDRLSPQPREDLLRIKADQGCLPIT